MDAPLGSVELQEAEELERLRRRAYGPDADIAGDAAAQARLSELEAAHHRQTPPVVDATARGLVMERIPVPGSAEGSRSATRSVPPPLDAAFAERQRAAASVTGPDPAEGPVADSGLVDGAPSAPWWRRRRWWVIAGGAIAVLVLNTALVAGMAQLLADGSSPIPTETATAETPPPVPAGLGRTSYVPVPDHVLALKSVGAAADRPNDHHGTLDALGISRDELTRYEDFQGPVVRDLHGIGLPLNVWSGESRSGMTCLFVAVPEQGIREGNGAEGCSPEGLDTITELRHMTGDGFTQFLLKDDHINVYVYVRAPNPSGSQG